MSEILMVIPEGWAEVTDAPSRIDEATLSIWLTDEPIMIESICEDLNLVQPGFTIIEGMKVPTSDGGFRLFVLHRMEPTSR